MFNQFNTEKFSDTDWSLVTKDDGSIDLMTFLTLVGRKLNIRLMNESDFNKSFVVIKNLESMLGPFNRDQAIAVAIHYCLTK